jgi:hypothetical protein
MAAVTPRFRLGQQVSRQQLVKFRHLRPQLTAKQNGRRLVTRFRARHYAQEAEQSLRLRRERAVGELKGCCDRALRVADHLQPCQQIRAAQLGNHACQALRRAGCQIGGGDSESQRQMRTEFGQFFGTLSLRVHTVSAQLDRQHFDGLLRGEDVQRYPGRTVADNQTCQGITAGHQRVTALAAGQERANLCRVQHVVQNYQHPPVGQDRPVQADLQVEVEGDTITRNPQGLEQHRQCLGDGKCGTGGAPA